MRIAISGARLARFVPVLSGLLAVALLAASAALAAGPPPPSVEAAKPLSRVVDVWDEYTGRFEAVERVEVRARVSGFVDKIEFKDGQTVKAGDPLFLIDPRPYQFAVESAQADLDRAKAQVTQTQADVGRANALSASVITQRDVDQRKSAFEVAQAQQRSAEVALANAKLNLDWTQVRAPIDGRISDRRIDVGNLVQGGQSGATLLTTIVKLDPIHFVFEAAEVDYLRYARAAAQVEKRASFQSPDLIQVRLADETKWGRAGAVDFIDNEIISRSGSIRGRALFANKDFFLTPGLFGRARLFGGRAPALLIPDEAVLADQTRKIVFVVGPGDKLAPKPVTLGPLAYGLRAIFGGLSPDDVVVVNGLANPFVRPGATVTPQLVELKPKDD